MKDYVVTEVWKVEARFFVQANSESEACQIVSNLGTMPDQEDFIQVEETIVEEVDYNDVWTNGGDA
jgi:hypothetical protein